MNLTPGTVIHGRYRIIRALGSGASGAVYQAEDLQLDSPVALKVRLGSDPRPFQQKAVRLVSLNHPHLAETQGHFVEPAAASGAGAQYLVMEFIEGEDLQSRLNQQGALPGAQALTWFEQILEAVSYMHAHGVTHGDIKPANIRITPAGQAVLVDWEIGKAGLPGEMTPTGAPVGSPGFTAPEQYRGPADRRSDIYALGATLYALLTGRVPPDATVLASGAASLTAPRRLNPVLSAGIELLILKALALEPDQRFQTVAEMQRALQRIRAAAALPAPAARPVPPRRSRTGGWPVVALIAILGLLMLFAVGGVMRWTSGAEATPASVAKVIEATPTGTPIPEQPTETLALASPTPVSLAVSNATPTATAASAFNPLPRAILAVVRVVVPMDSDRGFNSVGSGTLITSRGYILTNLHVVGDKSGRLLNAAGVISIQLTTDSNQPPSDTYRARLVQTDIHWDLALLQITAGDNGSKLPANPNFPVLPIGDPARLNLGDELLILGYPGLGGKTITLTRGTVAGFLPDDGWIKTDAEINMGNSGGAALNDAGELVGIPAMAETMPTPESLPGKIGFIRPINLAQSLIDFAKRESGE